MVGYNLCLFLIVQFDLQFEFVYGRVDVRIIVMNYVMQIFFVLCEQKDVNVYFEMFGMCME